MTTSELQQVAGRNSLTSLAKPVGRPMTPTSADPNLGETPIMLNPLIIGSAVFGIVMAGAFAG
jgi:hypothetical protein